MFTPLDWMQGSATSGGSSATINMVGDMTGGGLGGAHNFMDCKIWAFMVSLDLG